MEAIDKTVLCYLLEDFIEGPEEVLELTQEEISKCREVVSIVDQFIQKGSYSVGFPMNKLEERVSSIAARLSEVMGDTDGTNTPSTTVKAAVEARRASGAIVSFTPAQLYEFIQGLCTSLAIRSGTSSTPIISKEKIQARIAEKVYGFDPVSKLFETDYQKALADNMFNPNVF